MMNKNTRLAVVGILAALGSAPAQAAEVQQLPASFQELANEKCHPAGSYKLGDEKSVIPPCVAEQLIFTECEGRAGFINAEGARQPPGKQNMDIYKECVLGKNSTLDAERDGCLACKKRNEIFSDDEAKFWKDIYVEAASKLSESKDAKTLPELHEELRMQRKEFPKPLQENKNVTVPLEEYYPNPPKPQRAGDSEAVEEHEMAGDEGKGPVKRQVKVRADSAAFASSSFGCQRPGVGSFTPAMVPRSPDEKAASSASSMSSGVPTTLLRTVSSAARSTNTTGAPSSTRMPVQPGGVNGTKVANETSAAPPAPTTPTEKQPVDITFIFVIVFTPSQHVMKRQQDGTYVYVLVFGKPAPVADSPETPQKALGSREEGEKRGLPDISKCNECNKKPVALPDVVKADSGKPSTQKADDASKQCLDKVESAVQKTGETKVNITILIINIGVTAVDTTAKPDKASGEPAAPTMSTPNKASGEPAAPTMSTPNKASSEPAAPTMSTPDKASSEPAVPTMSTPDKASSEPAAPTKGAPEGESAAKPPAKPVGSEPPRPDTKGDAEGPGKAPGYPNAPAEKSGSKPPASPETTSSTPEATPTPEDWC